MEEDLIDLRGQKGNGTCGTCGDKKYFAFCYVNVTQFSSHIQGSTTRPFPGLVNIVPAVAYHLCLNFTAAFSQPGNSLKVEP